MTEDKQRIRVGIIDFLLLLGCLGVIEMLVVIAFWNDIIRNRSLKFLWPDQPLETLSVIALIFGLIGLFNYVFGLFVETVENYAFRKYLAGTFIISLIALGIAYITY